VDRAPLRANVRLAPFQRDATPWPDGLGTRKARAYAPISGTRRTASNEARADRNAAQSVAAQRKLDVEADHPIRPMGLVPMGIGPAMRVSGREHFRHTDLSYTSLVVNGAGRLPDLVGPMHSPLCRRDAPVIGEPRPGASAGAATGSQSKGQDRRMLQDVFRDAAQQGGTHFSQPGRTESKSLKDIAPPLAGPTMLNQRE